MNIEPHGPKHSQGEPRSRKREKVGRRVSARHGTKHARVVLTDIQITVVGSCSPLVLKTSSSSVSQMFTDIPAEPHNTQVNNLEKDTSAMSATSPCVSPSSAEKPELDIEPFSPAGLSWPASGDKIKKKSLPGDCKRKTLSSSQGFSGSATLSKHKNRCESRKSSSPAKHSGAKNNSSSSHSEARKPATHKPTVSKKTGIKKTSTSYSHASVQTTFPRAVHLVGIQTLPLRRAADKCTCTFRCTCGACCPCKCTCAHI